MIQTNVFTKDFYHTTRIGQPTPIHGGKFNVASGCIPPSLQTTSVADSGKKSGRFEGQRGAAARAARATASQNRGRSIHDIDARQSLSLDDPSLSPNNDRPYQPRAMAPLNKATDLDSDRPEPLLAVKSPSNVSKVPEPERPRHPSSSGNKLLRRGNVQHALRTKANAGQDIDWRFMKDQEYLNIREELHSGGRPDGARKLLDGILAGTKQAIARGSYPVVTQKTGLLGRLAEDVSWVDLWRYRHEVQRVSWLTAESIELPAGIDYTPLKRSQGFEPPITCCAHHPLTLADKVREMFASWPRDQRKPPLVVHMDVVLNSFGPGDAVSCLAPRAIDDSQESFFLRTDILEHIAATTRFGDFTEDFREQLMNSAESGMLFCQDVTLMRDASESGFSFFSEPLNINGVLVGALPTERPLVRFKDVPAEQMKQWGKGQTQEYAEEEHLLALNRYLDFVAKSVLTASNEPILILSLPGCMDRRCHPLHAVLRSLYHFRMRKGRLFSAVLIGCNNQELAVKADQVINYDLYGAGGHLEENWKSSYLSDIADELTTLSVNPVFRGMDPDFQTRNTLISNMQAQAGGDTALGRLLKRNAHKVQYLTDSKAESMLGSVIHQLPKHETQIQKSNILMHELSLLTSKFKKKFGFAGQAERSDPANPANTSFDGICSDSAKKTETPQPLFFRNSSSSNSKDQKSSDEDTTPRLPTKVTESNAKVTRSSTFGDMIKMKWTTGATAQEENAQEIDADAPVSSRSSAPQSSPHLQALMKQTSDVMKKHGVDGRNVVGKSAKSRNSMTQSKNARGGFDMRMDGYSKASSYGTSYVP